MDKVTYEEQLLALTEQHQFAMQKISHEIRNPVTLISSFLQIVESEHPEVTLFKHWDQIIENMDFLKKLLDEISDYNRSTTIHAETVNLYHLLENIVQDMSPSLSKRGIQILHHKRTALPPLNADSVKLKQAFHNLIRNSAEAIKKNGTISIDSFYENEHIIITIADDGSGIPDEYLPTIFEPFVTYKKEGTGLGLAITKNIISAHNGTIIAESNAGSGALFTLSLPI